MQDYNDGKILEANGGFVFEKDGISNGPFGSIESIERRFGPKTRTVTPKKVTTKPVEESDDAKSE